MIDFVEMTKHIMFGGWKLKLEIHWADGKVIEHSYAGDKEYEMFIDKSGVYIHRFGDRYYLDEINSRTV